MFLGAVISVSLCLVKKFWSCTTTAQMTPEVDPSPPLRKPHPPSGSRWSLTQTGRERRTREKGRRLTRWQPFIVKRRAVLRHNTLSAHNQPNLSLWHCSLGGCRGDEANPGRISVGLPCWFWKSAGWITAAQLKGKKWLLALGGMSVCNSWGIQLKMHLTFTQRNKENPPQMF